MKTKEILFSLLRAGVCEGTIDARLKTSISVEKLEQIYDLAKKYDVVHIVAQVLSNEKKLGQDEVSDKFKKAAKLATYRYLLQEQTYKKLCNALEVAKIPFLPLKGVVLRTYYPEPWMRTSCDIDVLVREDDLPDASKVLINQLNYLKVEMTDHDLTMLSPDGVHVELHYAVIDEGRLPEAQKILSNFWNEAAPVGFDSVHHYLSDEMFFFYHIAHMAKHFENGGCGIRPFLDLWILNHKFEENNEKRKEMLQNGGLLRFAEVMEEVSEVWFSESPKDPRTSQIEEYILGAGMYRDRKHQFAIQQARGKSKIQYFLRKVFLPVNELKKYYPILERRKYLLPICELARWFKLIFLGGIKKSVNDLGIYARISKEEITTTASLLKEIGLSCETNQ